MFTKYLALVSESTQVPLNEVAKISAALQKQITRDFAPLWKVPATIDFFQSLDDVPPDYWPIIIRDDIGFAGAAGIHLDRNGQPYALVQVSENVGMTCSHECLEMLADPFGNRFVGAQSLKAGQGRVNYLVEVCDPSEAEAFGYMINGILVSDFYTNNFFDPIGSPAVRYNFTGSIRQPRQVLPGGYLSWMIPETGEWWQATFFGASLTFRSLGVLNRAAGKGWREIIDAATFQPMEQRLRSPLALPLAIEGASATIALRTASDGHSRQLREDIEATISEAKQQVALSASSASSDRETKKRKGLKTAMLLDGAAPDAELERLVADKPSLPYLVKLSVLLSAGNHGDPDKLGDDEALDDYIKVQEQWVLLRAYLLRALQEFNPAGTISVNEIKGCSTVGELVELEKEKANQ